MASLRDSVGVLDLQGGVQEHVAHFRRLGIAAIPIKEPAQFDRLAGLVIPGGESSCLRRLLRTFGFDQPLLAAHRHGMKLWGTCAGAILLAREIVGEEACFNLIDIAVLRNAFGSQLDSFHRYLPAVAQDPLELTFIRAPKIIASGSDVRVLLTLDDYVAAAENANVLVTVFHPELTPSTAFHAYFANKCGLRSEPDSRGDEQWSYTDWMRVPRSPRPAPRG